jgi:hypothetical protein
LKHMKVKWEGLSHILWKKNETTNQVFNNCWIWSGSSFCSCFVYSNSQVGNKHP